MKFEHEDKNIVRESLPVRSPSELAFKGDKKHLDHFLLSVEKKVIAVLLPMVPSWMGTVHLTLMTIFWSIGVGLFGYLASGDIRWLWAFSVCVVFQHITDMLDGAVGRARNTGLIKWGFYADHFLDYIFMCAIIVGYSFLLPPSFSNLVLLCLIISGGLMVHTFLDFAITNDFKISFNRIGVSELRWLVIIFNMTLIFFGQGLLAVIFPMIVLIAFVVLVVVVYKSQMIYRRMDLGK
jgi:phosphatidylglycerophosphate synthase